MEKLKIKIATLGYIPFKIGFSKIIKWKSSIFEVDKSIDEYKIKLDSDTEFWGYSDKTIEKELPTNSGFDFLIAITNVPLEDKYYARRFSGNRICITFADVLEYMRYETIKLENYILRNIYRYSLVYLMYGNRIPVQYEKTNFTHDDTRKCLFDMNGNKTELIYSLDKPKICIECKHKLSGQIDQKVPDKIINTVEKEIKRIKKNRFQKINEFVKTNPVLSLFLTFLAGIVMSLIGTWLYELLRILICEK
ncbi:MAG: hypothetical protein KAU06_07985 [Candidatus Marinimicrobia bacterium]|nr:hypothetical protein [Candidatus Neomarinimicrobiota bacterium]